MPPEARISRDRILDGAVALIREQGHEALSARSLAARLGCSTQPLLYHFDSIGQLRREAYARVDALHTEAITASLDLDGSLLEVGLRYIRFAAEEPRLFRFLFQSDAFAGHSLKDITGDPQIRPLMEAAAQELETGPERARVLFETLFIAVHGYASLLANNAMRYDPESAREMLEQLGDALTAQIKEENHE